MKIAIASDHAAVQARGLVVALLSDAGHAVRDLGCAAGERVDYPDYAEEVARSVANGESDAGILLCGTGIGMSIAANKIAGVRAALVHDVTTAKLAAEHNNANVLCMGARVLGPVTIAECVNAWLDTEFATRHQHRLDKIDQLDQRD